MNELITQNLGEILGLLNELITSGVAVTKANLPELLRQVLVYGKTIALSYIWIGAVLVVISVICYIIDAIYDTMLVIAAIFLTLGGATMLIVGITNLVRIKTAPMLYLIQSVSSLIK